VSSQLKDIALDPLESCVCAKTALDHVAQRIYGMGSQVRFPLTIRLLGLALVLVTAGGCTNSSHSSQSASSGASVSATVSATAVKFDPQILRDFADNVVVPNQTLFAQRATELAKAIATYTKDPNSQTLKGAQSAWVETRAAWEQTECFGFGPAESLGYDGALDTWPVNETDLKAMLKSGDKLTADSVEKLKETEKGFHVIEYFLYGTDKNRQAQELKPRELKFLTLLGSNFAQNANNLSDAWSKGVEGKPAYRNIFATAGTSGNTAYPTVQAGATQILEGMLDSLGEVADEKIGKTFEQKNSKLAESRFSFNTLTDIKHNVMGSQNAYLGQFAEAKARGLGISSYVAQMNPTLDQQVKQQFKAALTALDQVPEPFEKSISDPKAAASIKAAQEAVNTLQTLIEKEVKPLFKSA
jgi:putative iron-regulated protein